MGDKIKINLTDDRPVVIAAGMIDWQTLKTKKACTPRGRDMYRFVDERSALEEAGYRPTLCVDHADWSSLTMWVAHDPDDDELFYETLAHIRKIVGEYDCHATETDQLRDSADGRRRQVIVVR